ncbi:hypothetical protein B0I37DRAFT_5456 [Chaetomium sp. MPI-CAGE-AT-0009]|nr:hypothetical protein B0I37DRAFT_5456 [Chaetomium sp. MPI-CAGE-AT-0009]
MRPLFVTVFLQPGFTILPVLVFPLASLFQLLCLPSLAADQAASPTLPPIRAYKPRLNYFGLQSTRETSSRTASKLRPDGRLPLTGRIAAVGASGIHRALPLSRVFGGLVGLGRCRVIYLRRHGISPPSQTASR